MLDIVYIIRDDVSRANKDIDGPRKAVLTIRFFFETSSVAACCFATHGCLPHASHVRKVLTVCA